MRFGPIVPDSRRRGGDQPGARAIRTRAFPRPSGFHEAGRVAGGLTVDAAMREAPR